MSDRLSHPVHARITLGDVTDPTRVPVVPGTTTTVPTQLVQAPTPPKRVKTTGEQVAFGVMITFGAAAVLAVAFALVAGTIKGGGGGSPAPEARDDVKVTSCGLTAGGNLSAELEVTNSTGRERSYFVTVAFTQGGTQLGTATAVVNDLQPGQKAVDEAVAFVRSKPSSLRCAVTKVSRV